MIPVFVYGTLKMGFGNNSLLKNSDYIDDAILRNYEMRYSHSSNGFPIIFRSRNAIGNIVVGELYIVDDNTLDALDYLESNGLMYDRKLVNIELSDNTITKAYTYIGNKKFWNNFEGLEPVGKKVHNWKK